MSGPARRVVLPPGGSWFDGHFPGHPILPGIAHLALLDRPLRGVLSLRLRRPLAPGDELAIEEGGLDSDGRFRASIRKGGVESSRAVLEAAYGAETLAGGPGGAPPGGEEDLTAGIPHRPPILCLERVVRADDRGATCAVRLPSTGAFVSERRVPAFFSLECAAQAAAVLESRRRAGMGVSRPRLGYLVGAKEARFAAAWIEAGARGTVRVDLEASVPPLAVYRFALDSTGREMASGVIQVWITATAA